MKKVGILITVAALVVGTIAVVVYNWLSNERKKDIEATAALPADAPLVVKIDSYMQISQSLKASNEWKSLLTREDVALVDRMVAITDSMVSVNPVAAGLLKPSAIYAAILPQGDKSNQLLVSLKVPENISISDIRQLIEPLAFGSYTSHVKTYNRTEMLVLTSTSNPQKQAALAIKHGILMVGSREIMVEETINRLESEYTLQSNQKFATINQMAGQGVDASLFINFSKLPVLLTSWLNDNFQANANFVADVGEWGEVDLQLTKSRLTTSGIITTSDSATSFLGLIAAQKPVQPEIPGILPAQTSFYFWLGISDLGRYLEDYRTYLDRSGRLFAYTQALAKIGGKVAMEPEELYKRILLNELCLVCLPSTPSGNVDEWYVVAQNQSSSTTGHLLGSLSGKGGSLPAASINVDDKHSYGVFRSPVPGIHRALFGDLFSVVSDEYYCLIDQQIVFGSSIKSLEFFIKEASRGTTLQNSLLHQDVEKELPEKANYRIYTVPSKAKRLLGNYLSNRMATMLTSSPTGKTGALACQLAGGNRNIVATLTVNPSVKEQVAALPVEWVCQLSNTPTLMPQVVVNHNTGEKEVLVQDKANTLYLIDRFGKTIWKRTVDGQVIGNVTQVDIFNNRKLQLAFSTSSKLYVIDRNGKDVQGFPVIFQSRATNPLMVVDYEGNHSYRFFQACSDRKIYVFDSYGKIVPGWMFGSTETIVSERIGYARVAGLDYIIVFDQNRPYILNRKGEERVKPERFFAKNPNSHYALGKDEKGSYFVVTSDTKGLIRFMYLNGKVKDMALRHFTSSHSFGYFDVTSDGQDDFVVADGEYLLATDHLGKKIFSTRFKTKLQPELYYFKLEQIMGIGVRAASNDENYLVDRSGEIVTGFPIEGCTMFSVAKLSNLSKMYNLIVGVKQGAVVCYTLNK